LKRWWGGIPRTINNLPGSGLEGMREWLEFVNGTLAIEIKNGTSLTISVPMFIKEMTRGDQT